MFTGLIQTMGVVGAADQAATGPLELRIASPRFKERPSVGDSIAVNGCCLTLTQVAWVEPDALDLSFQAVAQTLNLTTIGDLSPGDSVNLEAAATPTTLLGGHLVQGHVDGIGVVTAVASDEARVEIQPPPALRELIVVQGSITVAGVSLTVANVTEAGFEVALIPETLRSTTLGALAAGDRVNLESDILLRSVRHLLEARGLLAP